MDKIWDPITKEFISINSNKGKKILKNYINNHYLIGGSGILSDEEEEDCSCDDEHEIDDNCSCDDDDCSCDNVDNQVVGEQLFTTPSPAPAPVTITTTPAPAPTDPVTTTDPVPTTAPVPTVIGQVSTTTDDEPAPAPAPVPTVDLTQEEKQKKNDLVNKIRNLYDSLTDLSKRQLLWMYNCLIGRKHGYHIILIQIPFEKLLQLYRALKTKIDMLQYECVLETKPRPDKETIEPFKLFLSNEEEIVRLKLIYNDEEEFRKQLIDDLQKELQKLFNIFTIKPKINSSFLKTTNVSQLEMNLASLREYRDNYHANHLKKMDILKKQSECEALEIMDGDTEDIKRQKKMLSELKYISCAKKLKLLNLGYTDKDDVLWTQLNQLMYFIGLKHNSFVLEKYNLTKWDEANGNNIMNTNPKQPGQTEPVPTGQPTKPGDDDTCCDEDKSTIVKPQQVQSTKPIQTKPEDDTCCDENESGVKPEDDDTCCQEE